jgi:hypothetical protein
MLREGKVEKRGELMDAGRSFTWMFQQDGWIGKVIIGGLLLIIPIFGWLVVAGYIVRTLSNRVQGREELPAWDDWGDLLIKGLILTVVAIIYSLPGFVLSALRIPFLSALWSLVVYLVLPAGLLRYVTNGESFGAFFDFSWIISFIQENIGNYLLAFVLAIVAGIIAGFGIILLIIGVLFTSFWSSLVMADLYGQVYYLSPTKT